MSYSYTSFQYDISPSFLNDGYYDFDNHNYLESDISKLLNFYYYNNQIVSEDFSLNTDNNTWKTSDFNIFYEWYTGTGYNSPFKCINYIIINKGSLTESQSLETINSVVDDTLLVLNDIIKQNNILNSYNITIDLDQSHFDENEDVIGWADFTNKSIGLNENVINRYYYFNDVIKLSIFLILLHETLHILGLINLQSNYLPIQNADYLDTVTDSNSNLRYMWIGKHGLDGYKSILKDNNFDNNIVDNVLGLLLENDGPQGTKNVHIEEGKNDNSSYQKIYVNSIHYPSIINDITSGYLNTENYLTSVTTGLLKDIGFIVNEQSTYIMNNGSNIELI